MAKDDSGDRAFGEALCLRGLATAEEVDRYLAQLDKMRHLGNVPVPSLLELMTERGALDPAAATPPSAKSTPAGDPLGTDTGRYVFQTFLGRGGMGEVYKAWDKQLRRAVAVKFVHGHGLRDERRLVREAQLAARLNHPNIAPVFEIGAWQGRSFIAMQFVEGVTINRAGLDLRGKLRAMRDAALAVDYAHREGVIHRDLKPENLVVEQTAEGARVVVLDFGLAKPIRGGEKLSVSRDVVGTPAYMSPEQARGAKLNERGDIYSLGATLYEVLTGKPPFEGADILEVIRKVGSEEPARPRKLKPQIHRDLETIVLKCLEKDSNRRYGSAQELADDLERFLNHDPIRARPASTIYRLKMRLAKRKAVLATAAIASAALAVALGWWLLVGSPGAEHHRLMAAAMKLWDKVRVAAVTGGEPEDLRKKAKAAREGFERAIQVREEAEAQMMRGRCLDLEGQGDEALKALKRAHELEPGNADARMELVKVLIVRYQASRATPAAWHYSVRRIGKLRIRFKNPETIEERNWRERGEELLAGGDALPAQQELLRGLLFMGKGDYAAAAAALAIYTRGQRWDAQALKLEGACRFFVSDFDGALKVLNQLLSRFPSAAGFQLRGTLKEAMGHYDEAIADYTKAIELEPKAAEAYANRGQAKLALGALDEAIRDYLKAIELNPNSALAHSNLGDAVSEKGLHDEAITAYTKAIELNPKDPDFYSNRGVERATKGLHTDAIADYTKAIELEPKLAEAYANRGVAKAALGALDEAIRDYLKAIELNPKYAVAHANLGGALAAKGLLDEAIANCDKAIKLDPACAMAYCNRGNAKCDKGLLDETIADCDEAIKLDPRFALAYASRGNAKDNKGFREEATADYELALKVAPQIWPYRAMVQERVKIGKARVLFEQAYSLHELKRFKDAIEKFKSVAASLPEHEFGINSAYNIACGYALLAEKADALEWLEKAVEMGWKDGAHIEKDSDLESLRGDERYKKLVRSLKVE